MSSGVGSRTRHGSDVAVAVAVTVAVAQASVYCSSNVELDRELPYAVSTGLNQREKQTNKQN